MSHNSESLIFDVGVAQTDITPQIPIRLAGFADRVKSETTEVLHRLSATCVAFNNGDQNRVILIAVEIIGIQWRVTNDVINKISKRIGIKPDNITILVTHTHGSPEVGNLLNILQCRGHYPSDYYFNPSTLELSELIHIAQFNEFLVKKLVDVALAACSDNKPSLVSWGRNQVSFAENRRMKDGIVDHSLSVMCIKNMDGALKAVIVNYACHGISLGSDVNKIHGDWMGEAKRMIEERHPGCLAMVIIGCAGDLHPVRRNKIEYMKQYGREIAEGVDKILSSPLVALNAPLKVTMDWVKLPYSKIPDISQLLEKLNDTDIQSYYSRLSLEYILRGNTIPQELNYPLQVWSFANQMIMINLGGEAVVEYAMLLKQKYGEDRVWINSYANDVSSYIPTRRTIQEGGYEGDTSMYWYNQPSPFAEIVEQKILDKVDELIGPVFCE